MTNSIGMAIKITETNREKLSLVNGGAVPEIEEGVTTYFYFPYNFDGYCEILDEATFRSIYRFANDEEETYFVDVDML